MTDGELVGLRRTFNVVCKEASRWQEEAKRLQAENDRLRLELEQAKAVMQWMFRQWHCGDATPTRPTVRMDRWGMFDMIRAELAALEASNG